MSTILTIIKKIRHLPNHLPYHTCSSICNRCPSIPLSPLSPFTTPISTMVHSKKTISNKNNPVVSSSPQPYFCLEPAAIPGLTMALDLSGPPLRNSTPDFRILKFEGHHLKVQDYTLNFWILKFEGHHLESPDNWPVRFKSLEHGGYIWL